MDSDEDDLLNRIAQLQTSEWSLPSDLNRIAFDSFFQSSDAPRFVRSLGAIRVFGSSVADHQARLDAAGHAMVDLQRLVSATGASIRGIYTNRARLPSDVLALTQLRLVARPRLGSVVLDITPEQAPEVELSGPGGQSQLIDPPQRQLVDQAVSDAFALVASAHDIGPDVDSSEFLDRVLKGGPRVAAALRDFAINVEASDVDLDLEWREPHQATVRARFTSADATLVRGLVVGRDLATEPETIVGELITLSVARAWQVDMGDDRIVSIDVSHVEAADLTAFHLGERVEFDTVPVVREFPGGNSSTTYLARAIKSL